MKKNKKPVRVYKADADTGFCFKAGFIAGFIVFFIPIINAIFALVELPAWMNGLLERLVSLAEQMHPEGAELIFVAWGVFSLVIVSVWIALRLIRFRKKAVRVEVDSDKTELRYYKRKRLIETVDLNRCTVYERRSFKLLVLPSVEEYVTGHVKERVLDCSKLSEFYVMLADAEQTSKAKPLRADATEFLQRYLERVLSRADGKKRLLSYITNIAEQEILDWANNDNHRDVLLRRFKEYQTRTLETLKGHVSAQVLQEYEERLQLPVYYILLGLTDAAAYATAAARKGLKLPKELTETNKSGVPQEITDAFWENTFKTAEFMIGLAKHDLEITGKNSDLSAAKALRDYSAAGGDSSVLVKYITHTHFAQEEPKGLPYAIKGFTMMLKAD